MLRPELQSMDDFIDGLDNIIDTQRRVALNYFEDGGIDAACPPLKALLHIMAHGEYRGENPAITRKSAPSSPARPCSASDWYQARLDAKVTVDRRLWDRHVSLPRSIPRQAELSGRTPPPAHRGAPRQRQNHPGSRPVAGLPRKPRRHDRHGPGPHLNRRRRTNRRSPKNLPRGRDKPEWKFQCVGDAVWALPRPLVYLSSSRASA